MTLEPATVSVQPQVDPTASEVAEALASSASVDAVAPITAEPEQVDSSEPAGVSGAAALEPVGTALEQAQPAEAEPSALAGDAAVEQVLLEAVLADPAQPEPDERVLHAAGCACAACSGGPSPSPSQQGAGANALAAASLGTLDQLADYLETQFWTDSNTTNRNFNLRSQERMPNLVS